MVVLSADLAYRDYRDIGVAVLHGDPDRVEVQFQLLEGGGTPTPKGVVNALLHLAEKVRAEVMLLDGPQGWRDPNGPYPNSRTCERILNTPAKTGLPGQVKPANYLPFVSFCIEVFDELARQGWPRFAGDLSQVQHCAVESFPLSAWRALGIPILPAKAKARQEDLESRTRLLVDRFRLSLNRAPNHDELQALVSGLAGLPLLREESAALKIDGIAPFELEGAIREGFIVNPR